MVIVSEQDRTAISKAFGQQIRRLRVQRGLSQPQLASACGITQVELAAIEHGQPGVRLFTELATALHVSASELRRVEVSISRLPSLTSPRVSADLESTAERRQRT